MTAPSALTIRPATPADTAQILDYIKGLANYEKLSHEVVATEEAITASLFGERPDAAVLMAEWNGEPAGFALYHFMYSTFIARSGMYLEDLFVKPQFRGHGIGTALLIALAKVAVDDGHCRLDWSCLTWNEPSLNFYRGIGAREMDDWVRLRLDGDALAALAERGA